MAGEKDEDGDVRLEEGLMQGQGAGDRGLAGLAAAVEQELAIGAEQQVALPGIDGDAPGPSVAATARPARCNRKLGRPLLGEPPTADAQDDLRRLAQHLGRDQQRFQQVLRPMVRRLRH